jgi:hypothetical protein
MEGLYLAKSYAGRRRGGTKPRPLTGPPERRTFYGLMRVDSNIRVHNEVAVYSFVASSTPRKQSDEARMHDSDSVGDMVKASG